MLGPDDIAFAAAEARRIAGLSIAPDQGYLIESRLASLARAEGQASASGLIAAMRRSGDARLIAAMTSALADGESGFFHEPAAFDLFSRDLLPVLARARGGSGRVRIWCAGVSGGQEAYSLAMLLTEEAERLNGLAVDIVATDFRARAIEKAKTGVYSHFDVQRGLSVRRLVAHFEQTGQQWRLAAPVRQRVEFRVHNLMQDDAALGVFDIVFCRRVIGAIAPEARKTVLERIGRHTATDGYLILGAGETVAGAGDVYRARPACRGVYAKAEAEAIAA